MATHQANPTNAQVISCLAPMDGGMVVSGSWDTTVRLWGPGGQEQVMVGHDAAVLALALVTTQSDGDVIVSAGGDGKLKVWSPSGHCLTTIERAHKTPIRCAAACGPGVLCTGDNAGELRRWCVAPTTVKLDGSVPAAHSSYIFALVATSRLVQVFSGGDDNLIKRWQVDESGPPIHLQTFNTISSFIPGVVALR